MATNGTDFSAYKVLLLDEPVLDIPAGPATAQVVPDASLQSPSATAAAYASVRADLTGDRPGAPSPERVHAEVRARLQGATLPPPPAAAPGEGEAAYSAHVPGGAQSAGDAGEGASAAAHARGDGAAAAAAVRALRSRRELALVAPSGRVLPGELERAFAVRAGSVGDALAGLRERGVREGEVLLVAMAEKEVGDLPVVRIGGGAAGDRTFRSLADLAAVL